MTANRFRFRVWDEEDGRYLTEDEPYCITNDGMLYVLCDNGMMPAIGFDPESSTGLLDSQGREIFDGDKAKYFGESYPIGRHPLHGHFTIGEEQLLTYGDARVCTITGNIHEVGS